MSDEKSKNSFTSKLSGLFFRTPFGTIGFASFIIAAITGVMLALPYDVRKAYDSISLILLSNPAGVFVRNLHYWSAQIFLIFTFLHIYDHLRRSTEDKVTKGIWLRLTISLLFVFFVMLSGFILKFDADGQQAFRILSSLIEQIPFIGDSLSFALLGKENDLQILYVNHIATATIFLWIIILEHAKLFWVKTSTFVSTLLFSVFLSFLFTPALHDGRNPIVKGPWYFLGFQEIFHWLSQPYWVLIAILILLIFFYFIPGMSDLRKKKIKAGLLIVAIFYLFLTAIGFFFRGEDWKFMMPWSNPAITNFSIEPFENLATVEDSLTEKEIPIVQNSRREGCLVCHSDVKGFTPSHNPEAIGCSSCHGGNPFSLSKKTAHNGMKLIPGDLSDAKLSCGTSQCHPDIPERVNKTLMTTLSGLVSVDRFVFNESETPTKLSFVDELGHSPADKHLRNLCASCHLGGKKESLGAINELSRGGGCLACHLNYSNEAIKQLNNYKQSKKINANIPTVHPQISLEITNDHCFGCHSRSGRISTNYEGWFETELLPEEVDSTDTNFRFLLDDRVFQKTDDDVHHQKGMNCIDCHTSKEVMGDGNYYLHEEDQVKIKCTDCHTDKPETISYNNLDAESQKIINVRNSQRKGFDFLKTRKANYPLINTFVNEKTKPFLITKLKKDSLTLKPPAFACTEGKAHSTLSCNSCHTKWVTHCVGCHTEYDPSQNSFDLLERKTVDGKWIEYPSNFFAEPPTLGVREDSSGTKTVETFIPGMIISIKKNKKDKEIFKRLYAPTVAHTISKESRTCKSCHNNPLAIGYGRGELIYKKEGRFGVWSFKPELPLSQYDGLPLDAWIPFLKTKKNVSTRLNNRPFNKEEQKRILTVGACLTCHEENSTIIKNSLIDFNTLLKNISNKCLLPRWD